MTARVLGEALVAECEFRLFEQSFPRLRKCIALMSEEELWFRPNAETVSAGNLVLHLCGNMRQWICSGLGSEPDRRKRAEEFTEPGPMPKSLLYEKLDTIERDAKAVLRRVDPETLLDKRPVQAYEETGLSCLVHVVEHFSYHVGQITYMVKSRLAVDTQYYAGEDLNKTV
ncbi:MAG: DinB family protein [Candidatus Hydrogenedentales bacterium]